MSWIIPMKRKREKKERLCFKRRSMRSQGVYAVPPKTALNSTWNIYIYPLHFWWVSIASYLKKEVCVERARRAEGTIDCRSSWSDLNERMNSIHNGKGRERERKKQTPHPRSRPMMHARQIWYLAPSSPFLDYMKNQYSIEKRDRDVF